MYWVTLQIGHDWAIDFFSEETCFLLGLLGASSASTCWLTLVCWYFWLTLHGFGPSAAFRFQVRVCAGLSCITNVARVLITTIFPEGVWAKGSSNNSNSGACQTFSHPLIFTSVHLHIFSSLHFTSSHPHIFSLTCADLGYFSAEIRKSADAWLPMIPLHVHFPMWNLTCTSRNGKYLI